MEDRDEQDAVFHMSKMKFDSLGAVEFNADSQTFRNLDKRSFVEDMFRGQRPSNLFEETVLPTRVKSIVQFPVERAHRSTLSKERRLVESYTTITPPARR